MDLSMKWLSDFVELDTDIKDFVHRMTMSGSKVETYEVEGSDVTNVVVGKILSVEKHPDADKLVVCQLDVGKDAPIQIVTGASNVFPGAIVPVALDGSTLPGGIKIKKGKLRGVESNGMLCSLAELNLTTNDFPYAIKDGIFIIEEDCTVGQDIHDALSLNDTCVEFEITSNRPDCLSVIGLAREAAATYNLPLKLHTPEYTENNESINDMLSAKIENNKLCKRYMAKVVKNIKVEPSPLWMRERLRASGVRPINNIVDITNYVMLEYGQPMHAFDYKYVTDGQIIVRNAKEGETIVTLDGEEKKLTESMLVIADSTKPMAVAGVMGGEFSGIMDDTNTIVFESACFDGPSVRITAKKLGLRTESSGRFEKGLDPNNCKAALDRACELVQMLGVGEIVGGTIDEGNYETEPKKIKFECDWMNSFLSLNVSKEEMIDILARLDCKVEDDYIIVPTYRADLEHKADIAEEIARIYGYDRIPTTQLSGTACAALTPEQKFERETKNLLVASGMNEVVTFSFVPANVPDKLNVSDDSKLRDCVVITNPISEDMKVMRTSAAGSMLEVLTRNYNNRNAFAKLFEIATVYTPVENEDLPDEHRIVSLGMYGEGVDFFDLKGVVDVLLARLCVKDAEIVRKTDNPTYHPGRCAAVVIDGREIGVFGEVHPEVLNNYGLDCKAYIAEIELRDLFANAKTEKTYKSLPKFPATTRDLALLCDDDLTVAEIEKTIRNSVPASILENVELFDVYKGKQIEDNKKSVAFNIVLRSAERTLTDEETDSVIKKVLKNLEKIGATLR